MKPQMKGDGGIQPNEMSGGGGGEQGRECSEGEGGGQQHGLLGGVPTNILSGKKFFHGTMRQKRQKKGSTEGGSVISQQSPIAQFIRSPSPVLPSSGSPLNPSNSIISPYTSSSSSSSSSSFASLQPISSPPFRLSSPYSSPFSSSLWSFPKEEGWWEVFSEDSGSFGGVEEGREEGKEEEEGVGFGVVNWGGEIVDEQWEETEEVSIFYLCFYSFFDFVLNQFKSFFISTGKENHRNIKTNNMYKRWKNFTRKIRQIFELLWSTRRLISYSPVIIYF